MDIEDLSVAQILLLVLLVTFVTSIATGIVTVALLAQAPPAVTQTVNHIIQRTVEAVAPSTGTTPSTPVKETTVVVKEDDLVTSSISTAFAKIGIIHESVSSTSPVVALGALVQGGLLITDSAAVTEDPHVVTFDATSTVYTIRIRYADIGVAVMAPKDGSVPTGGFRIGDVGITKLGQSVVALPSASGTRIGLGSIVARYNLAHLTDDSKADVPVRAIDTNISGKIGPGTPLINVFGDVVGIATGVSQGGGSPGTFVGLSDIAPLFLGVKGTSTPALAPGTPTL